MLTFIISEAAPTSTTTYTYAMGLILPSATPSSPSKSSTYATGLIPPSATQPPSKSSTYAMGLLLPSSTTTQIPSNNNVPHPEPEPVPGDLTPENGLYSTGSSPVQPETSAIPKPENQIPFPGDIDICKLSFVYFFKFDLLKQYRKICRFSD